MKDTDTAESALERECDTLRERIRQLEDSLETARQATVAKDLYYGSILDAIQDGINIIDTDLNILRVNKTVRERHAASASFVGKKCYRVFQQRENPCPWCPSLPAIRSGRAHTEIIPYTAGKEQQGWIELSAFPLTDSSGAVTAVIECSRDITARRRGAALLQQSEDRYRTVVETVQEGIILQDASGRILTWNRGAEQALGISADEVVGHVSIDREWPTIYEDGSVFPSAEHPSVVTLRTGSPCRDVLMGFRRESGAVRWVSINTCPVAGEPGGLPAAVVITFRDVTDIRAAQQELERRAAFDRLITAVSDRLLRADFEATDDAVTECLARVADFAGADRAFVFLLRAGATLAENTHLWCREPSGGGMPAVDLEGLPWFAAQLRAGTLVHVPDAALLPGEAGAEQRVLLRQGIRSRIVVPLHTSGAVAGYLGFDVFRRVRDWSAFEQAALLRAGEAIGQALDRKRVFEAMREHRFRLQMALEGSRAAWWDWNVQTGEVVFNERWAGITGYRLSDLDPVSIQTWIDLCHPDDLETSNAALQAHFSGRREDYDCEARMKHRDGHWVWVHDHGRVYEWTEDGRPLRMAGTHLDISDQKHAAVVLAERETRMRLIFDSLPDCVLQVDGSMHVTWANRAACQLNEHIVGHTCWEAFREMSLPCTGCAVARCLETGQMETIEMRHDWFAGTSGTTWWSCLGIPLKGQTGAVTGAVALLRNETGRVRMEESLRQSQKMESLGTLAGGIAHEFNNILGGIVGYTELERDEAPPDSALSDSLNEIVTLCMRARNVVRQILTFSRKSPFSKEIHQPHRVVQEQLKMLRNIIPSNIEISTDIDEHCGTVLADATQLQQVGLNLCTNAVHAMQDQGGVLSISLDRVVLDEAAAGRFQQIGPGDYVRLRVRDTGCGIPPNILGRIFDPFFTTKAAGAGTGMGLAVVHGIVCEHGGAIAVASTPGQGTTFTVVLPLAKENGQSVCVPESDTVPGGCERILVVDDEPFIVGPLKRMLERLGYTVTAMTGSTETLELFRKCPHGHDLLITDLTMPGLTGDRLAAEILSSRPDMPVILATGYADRVESEPLKACGITAFITKPFRRQELAAIVRTVLDDGQKNQAGADVSVNSLHPAGHTEKEQ